MTIITNIPYVKYASGAGWSNAFDAGVATLPIQVRDNVRSEANITWNVNGGCASGAYFRVLNAAIEQLNAGKQLHFPKIEWNAKFVADQKAR